MRVLHGLIDQPNIMMSLIYQILKAHKDHTMQLAENGDTLQSELPLISEC